MLKLPEARRTAAAARRRSSPTSRHHPAIAPLVEGGEVKEYSAHLIPEAGLAMMPKMTADGLLVAGDAAAMCLAAGIWLEGVNFAMASGMYAGEAAAEALRAGDTSAAGLARLRAPARRHVRAPRPPQAAPRPVARPVRPGAAPLSGDDRQYRGAHVPRRQPARRSPGLRRILNQERKRAGVKLKDLARDGLDGLRSYG